MQQLQEQLQLNLIQQTHLLQTGDKKKAAAPLQQLALQQQQLMQQLQITQRQYLLQQGIGIQPMVLAQVQAQAQAQAQAQGAGRPKAAAVTVHLASCPSSGWDDGWEFCSRLKPMSKDTTALPSVCLDMPQDVGAREFWKRESQ